MICCEASSCKCFPSGPASKVSSPSWAGITRTRRRRRRCTSSRARRSVTSIGSPSARRGPARRSARARRRVSRGGGGLNYVCCQVQGDLRAGRPAINPPMRPGSLLVVPTRGGGGAACGAGRGRCAAAYLLLAVQHLQVLGGQRLQQGLPRLQLVHEAAEDVVDDLLAQPVRDEAQAAHLWCADGGLED